MTVKTEPSSTLPYLRPLREVSTGEDLALAQVHLVLPSLHLPLLPQVLLLLSSVKD